MKHTIDLAWTENMVFETELNGHKIILDADEKSGGENKGPRPKPLMLVSLAGCSGIDVVSILKKMRVKIDSFNVKVEGNLTEEYPKQYDKIKIIYEFGGENLSIKKLEKVVTLSQEKYCGVLAVYKKTMEIVTEIKLV